MKIAIHDADSEHLLKQNEMRKKELSQTQRKLNLFNGMPTAEFSGGKAGRNTALKEISLKKFILEAKQDEQSRNHQRIGRSR